MKSYNGFPPDQRQRAQVYINDKIRAGLLEKPTPCDTCGQVNGAIDLHAEDYSEPFGPHVHRYALCYTCHLMLHCRFRNRERFNQYVKLVEEGHRFPPVRGRNFREFVARFLDSEQLPADDTTLRPGPRNVKFGEILAEGARLAYERSGL